MNQKNLHLSFINLCCIAVMLLFISCSDDKLYVPKPKMFPRIIYPVAEDYLLFDTTLCSFSFVYPDYATIKRDSFIFEGQPSGPCWFDLNIPSLSTSLHCSYYTINKSVSLDNLINDAFSLAGKHNVKANFRKESLIQNEYGVSGLIFEIDGPVASPLQFYLTDSVQHFFRASLYFNSKVNRDSTNEVFLFVKKDIDKMLETFRWKK